MFEYYIILDFEATCERDQQIRPQEIIEFPSVLLHADSLTEISRFQRYIKPVHNHKLTQFCTELTGITQETVDSGCNFKEVLGEYLDWLTEHGCNSTNSVIITCGDWDLKTMLPEQCQLSRTTVPGILKQWINIKTEFRYFYKVTRPGGMTKMLSSLNLELEGRHHSGIDDCHNTGRIWVKMCQDGYLPSEKSLKKLFKNAPK